MWVFPDIEYLLNFKATTEPRDSNGFKQSAPVKSETGPQPYARLLFHRTGSLSENPPFRSKSLMWKLSGRLQGLVYQHPRSGWLGLSVKGGKDVKERIKSVADWMPARG